MSKFGADLVQSAEEALAIARGEAEPAFAFPPSDVDVVLIRKRKGMSQQRFAETFGLSVSAVRDWEQGRRYPDRTARILLSVIDKRPDAVLEALSAET